MNSSIGRLNRAAKAVLALAMAGAMTWSWAGDWDTVTDTSLIIRDGGPLDFSAWLPAGPAGVDGAVMVGAKGRLVFANKPTVPAKLSCVAMQLNGATGGFPDRATADVYAHQIKLHGYNLVRMHFLEPALMKNGATADFDFDPVQLDRLQYFLAALKKEGVYWLFDVMTSENGFYGNVPDRWAKNLNLKYRIYQDPVAQKHWKDSVDKLLMLRNPYTGLTILNDPALAGVTLVNEGGIQYLSQTRLGGLPKDLIPAFNTWLKETAKFADTAALRTAWGDVASDEKLQSAVGATDGTVRSPAVLRSPSKRMSDYTRFLTYLEVNTGKWMSDYIRSKGYNGPITSFNNYPIGQADATRASMSWIDMHGYQDEVVSTAAGTSIPQTSALSNRGRYARWLAVSRHGGKPFSVTEYGQPFWSKYRFEAGALVPAMAAFQGWDFACQHAEGGVDMSLYLTGSHKKLIVPYNVGQDPIARAGETLGALLHMRGDVAPSTQRVSISYNADDAYTDQMLNPDPNDLSSIAWVVGTEIVFPGEKTADPYPYVIYPVPNSKLTIGLVKTPEQMLMNYFDLGTSVRISKIRSLGMIDAANLTDVSKNLYQSDTKQLLMDGNNSRFTITTPKTEAVVTNIPLSGYTVKTMKVASINGPALLSASALDNVPLATSKKILLILSSDAENTGMTFADTERKTMLTMGTMPPRILRTSATLTLALSHTTKMKLTSLRLNGEPGDAQTVSNVGGNWTMTLSTANPKGPTTFFLLEPM